MANKPIDQIQDLAMKVRLVQNEAACSCEVGMQAVSELRAVLRAIELLSVGGERFEDIRELATVGVRLADDRHNTLDVSREEFAEASRS